MFGAGYIGSRLIQDLLDQGREVVAFDNFFASDRRTIEEFQRRAGFRLVEGSIVDPTAIERAFALVPDLDAVYLLAAQASAHPEAATPEYSEEANLRGPRLVLDAAARRGLVAPIVFASSTRILGSPLPAVVDEATPYGIVGDLAHLSKCYVEKLFEMYAAVHRLRCRVVRLGLVYGIAPVMKTDPRFMTAPNLFCYRATQRAPLEVRSHVPLALIHVEDASGALRWAAERMSGSGFAIFNAPAQVSTIPEVAEQVRRIGEARGLSVSVRPSGEERTVDQPAMPIFRSALAASGFSARRGLCEGLDEAFDYFRKQVVE